MCNRKREEPRAVFPRRGVWWGWSPLGPRRRGVRFRERLCNPSPAVKENRGAVERNADWAQQAAEKGPSAALARSRGAATYRPSTPRTSPPAPPCIWTFLSSLGKRGFFSTRLIQRSAFILSEVLGDVSTRLQICPGLPGCPSCADWKQRWRMNSLMRAGESLQALERGAYQTF